MDVGELHNPYLDDDSDDDEEVPSPTFPSFQSGGSVASSAPFSATPQTGFSAKPGGGLSSRFVKSVTIQPSTEVEGGAEPMSKKRRLDDDIDDRFKFTATEKRTSENNTQSNIGPSLKPQIGRSENELAGTFGGDVLEYFKRMNWKGAGLGEKESGIANPIQAAFGRTKLQGIQEDEHHLEANAAEKLFRQEVEKQKKVSQSSSAADILFGKNHMQEQDEVVDLSKVGRGKKRFDRGTWGEKTQKSAQNSNQPRRERRQFDGGRSPKAGGTDPKGVRIVDMSRAGGPVLVTGGNLADHLRMPDNANETEKLECLGELRGNVDLLVTRGRNEVAALEEELQNLKIKEKDLNGLTEDMPVAKLETVKEAELFLTRLDKLILPEMENESAAARRLFILLEFFEKGCQSYSLETLKLVQFPRLVAEHVLEPFQRLVELWDVWGDPSMAELAEDICPRLCALIAADNRKTSAKGAAYAHPVVWPLLAHEAGLVTKFRNALEDPTLELSKSRRNFAECVCLMDQAALWLVVRNSSDAIADWTNLVRLRLLPLLQDATSAWHVEHILEAWHKHVSGVDEHRDMEEAFVDAELALLDSAPELLKSSALFFPDEWLLVFRDFFTQINSTHDFADLISDTLIPSMTNFFERRWNPTFSSQQLFALRLLQPWAPIRKVPFSKDAAYPEPHPLARSLVSDTQWLSLSRAVSKRLTSELLPDDSTEVATAVIRFLRLFCSATEPQILSSELLFFRPLRTSLRSQLGGQPFLSASVLHSLLAWYKRWRGPDLFNNQTLQLHTDLSVEFAFLLECFEAVVLDDCREDSPSAFRLDWLLGGEEGETPNLRSQKQTQQTTERTHEDLIEQWAADERRKNLDKYHSMGHRREKNSNLGLGSVHDLGLPEVLAECAAEGDMSMTRAHPALLESKFPGKKWYTFGGDIFMYWEADVIYVVPRLSQGSKAPKPVTIEKLLKMASSGKVT